MSSAAETSGDGDDGGSGGDDDARSEESSDSDDVFDDADAVVDVAPGVAWHGAGLRSLHFYPRSGVRVLACDPGLTNIYTLTERFVSPTTGREAWRTWQLTAGEYHQAAGRAHRLVQRRRLDAPIAAALELLAQTSDCARTTSAARARERLLAVAALAPCILARRLAYVYARHERSAAMAKQRVLAAFWSTVKRGRVDDGTAGLPCVIAYGAAKFKSSVGGSRPVPTATARRACQAVFGAHNVFFVNEHRTSVTCADCSARLHAVVDPARPTATSARTEARKAREAAVRAAHPGARGARPPRPPPREGRAWALHGVKYCASDACAATRYKNRDTNAAKNILAAFLAAWNSCSRPLHLTRRKHMDPAQLRARKAADAAARRPHVLPATTG